MMDNWIRVNIKKGTEPCPVCGHGDWCMVSRDGKVAICQRTQSPKKVGDAGWLHRLKPELRIHHSIPPAPKNPPRRPVDFESLIKQWRWATRPGLLEEYAASLGVPLWTVKSLGALWAPEHRAWAWPMRGADRKVIGIRLRNSKGEKWAVSGSHNGLFIPDGVPSDLSDTLMICEGPTTCAALLGLNYCVIGRASCSTCADLVTEMFREDRRHAVIIADEDAAKRRPDGTIFYPGQQGAAALAKALHGIARSVKIVYPLIGKDARDWIAAGATREVIDSVIANTLIIP